MRSLKITAHLANSIGLTRSEDIALDGILASQVLKRHYGDEYYYLPNAKERLHFARLPLDMRGTPSQEVARAETGYVLWDTATCTKDESLWHWACSSASITIEGRDTHYWVKRFDTKPALSDHIDFGGRVEHINTAQGRFKAYRMPDPMLIAPHVIWYAYGDAQEIERLLRPVYAIAKKRSQGEGQVLKWTVEEIAEDCSTWKDNALVHPLPGPLAQGILWQEPPTLRHIAFRAPQWHPMHQALCVVGGRRK